MRIIEKPFSLPFHPLWTLCIACLFAFSAGCSQNPSQDTLAKIQEAGKVRVGFANEIPFAYMDTESGELAGEAPAVARHILGQIGVTEIEGVLVEFGALIPGLKAGRFDLIAAGMYVTPERCKQIAFSEPTYCIGEGFLVLKGNPLGLNSYHDVKNHETARLGVVSGTVEVGYAKKVGIPDDRLVRFPDMPSAAAGVKAGRADAFAGTSLTISDLLHRLGDESLERAQPFEDLVIDGNLVKGCGAFGFRKEDRSLRAGFNERLRAFIGTEEHLALIRPFGFGAATLPGDATAETLCGE